MAPWKDMPSNDVPRPAPSLAGRVAAHLRIQPGRSALTGLLLCVLAVLVVRSIGRPGTASANGGRLLPAAAATQPLAHILSPEALLQMALPALAPAPVADNTKMPSRDIFAVDLRRFPKVGSKTDDEPVEEPAVEPVRTPESLLAELKRQAAALRLEGTVTGQVRVAFLNGTSVAEGQEYRGFRLAEVAEQSVQLERDGMRVELRMPE